jgi:superfamily II DNA/RNA helicase
MLEAMHIKYVSLSGSVPGHKRKQLIEDFTNQPDCRIFLSTDAGGTGLNLQAASMVINMDLPWNPAVLEQRIARVYRYGQQRNVSVINFVALNTIEHGMLSRLSFKKALAEGILDNGEPNIFIGESKLNAFMKGVEDLVNSSTVKSFAPHELVTEENLETPNTTDAGSENTIEEDEIATEPVQAAPTETATAPVELLSTFSSFVSQLTQVLSSPASTQQLVNSITRKDEQTGQTYLQIPVANADVVQQAVNLLGALFKGK